MLARLNLRVLAVVAALGPIFPAFTRTAGADPSLGNFSTFQLVSSRPISSLVTEFEYRVPLTADLQDLAGASVTVTSVSRATRLRRGVTACAISESIRPAGDDDAWPLSLETRVDAA